MLNVDAIRNDFPMFRNHIKMQNKPLVWLDNASTTFKPDCVLEAISSYYSIHTSNAHRGDYDLSYSNDCLISSARSTVAKFINANDNEVIFTSGTTESLNLIAYSYGLKFLKKDDEILISKAEHASNILPWYQLEKLTGCKVKFIPLTKEGRITLENVEKSITSKTRLISLAWITNVLGYIVPIKEICALAHKHNIIVSVDGAQSTPHLKTDVKDLDCDFLSFSGHKMCGPTGTGVLYGKFELLQSMDPFILGGGMNVKFASDGSSSYLDAPAKFEAGTVNIEGILGLAKAIEYLSKIGLDNIESHEKELRTYLISRLKECKNITIYNEKAESGIVTFNFSDVFAQDAASLFNSKGVAVRSGQHCAKILPEVLGTPATVRVSLYFYNDKNDVDVLIDAVKNGGNFLDAFFN